MKTKTILGMPAGCFFGVTTFLIVGIIIGSFCDFDINVALANKTNLGAFFATYGSYFSYCLYPAAGMCLFLALKKKDKKYNFLAWVILIASYFLAVYYSNSYNGSKVREAFGYVAGESSPCVSILSWGLWVVLYAWVPIALFFLLDDQNPNQLIAVGLTILVAGLIADNVNLWLKQVASRPRYKYLITLDDPKSEFRNWWEMVPNLAGSNDNFKSWPSGNMTIASMMFSLPLILRVFKKKSNLLSTIGFIFACIFVTLYGYNRIHMTNHFLSDVCFGTLITYVLFAIFDGAFQKIQRN